ncbi:MAG: dihydroorotase [Hellea sp.]|nr:dihydroorotase [Hellea sp.]
MTNLTIEDVRILDPQSGFDDIGNIVIANGQIKALGDVAAKGETIDGRGLVAAPGLIDMRVTTGEPGAESRESIESAALAAAAGGVTTMVVMPDTKPVIDDVSLINYITNKAEQTLINVHVAGALTQSLDGKTMTEIGLMSEAGAVMFSNGAEPVSDSLIMRRLLSYSARFNALIANRPIDSALAANSCAHESDFSSRLGLPGHPPAAERIVIDRDAALAELTGGRLLIDMISSEEGLSAVRRAKSRDIEIACSVSMNHLALNEIDIGDYRTFAKLDPPLREETDRQALISGVNDGTIDVVVSAHNPRPAGQKRLPYTEAASGAVGLELLLSAGLTQVANGELDLMKFLACLTSNPASLLDLPTGRLAEGAPADIVLFDMNMPWVCDSDKLLSKSKNTPFDERRMTGRVVMTLCGGRLVFERLSSS